MVIRNNKYLRSGFANNTMVKVAYSENGYLALRDIASDQMLELSPSQWYDEDEEHHVQPPGVPLRYAYAITAHTAQGGEWPKVLADYNDYLAQCRNGRADEANRWLYTAVTRAKEKVGLIYRK